MEQDAKDEQRTLIYIKKIKNCVFKFLKNYFNYFHQYNWSFNIAEVPCNYNQLQSLIVKDWLESKVLKLKDT